MSAADRRRARTGLAALAAALTLTSALLLAGCRAPAPSPRDSGGGPSSSAEGTRVRGEDMDSFLSDSARDGGLKLTERSGGDFGADRMSFHASAAAPSGTYLQVAFPAGSASQSAARSDGTAEGGAQSYWNLDEPLDEAYLRYWVWFPAGFDFVKGGKLPGLYGGTRTSGGDIPDGTDGFSTRYMWRQDGAGEVYAYLPTSSGHGTSLGRGAWTFPTGRWACLEQHVTLNSPGSDDGAIDVWLDGQRVWSADSLQFRSTAQLQIEGLFFSTFFGGGDESWATPSDQVIRFGGFAISPHRLGCG